METQRIRVANPSARKMSAAQKAWFSKSAATRSKYKTQVYGKRAAEELAKGGRKRPAKRRAAAKPKSRAAAPKKRSNVTSIVRVEPVRRAAPKKRNAGAVAVYKPQPRQRNAPRFGFKLPGKLGQAAGVIGGGVVTKLIMDNLVPPGMRVGFVGYLTSAAVAMAQGWGAGQVLSKKVGDDMALGGWVYTALRIAQDTMPPFAAFVNPFGGVGEIVESSFPMPPVTLPGNINRYYMPRDTRDYVAKQIAEAQYVDSMVGDSTTLNANGVGPRDASGGVVTMESVESDSAGMGCYGAAYRPGAWAA